MMTSFVRSTKHPSDTDSSRTPLLVVVPDGLAKGQPRIFLADSERQTELDRIFTCGEDVVRLSRHAAVVVRPLRPLSCSIVPDGERDLLRAVLRARTRGRASSWAGADQHAVPAPRADSLNEALASR